jgi:DNA polymerase I-like protein with 3'-5' exonuclease and polymerase domains
MKVELRNRQLEEKFLKGRMRVLARLAEMECAGVRIDIKTIEMSMHPLQEEADALKKLVFQEAGCEFDLDSRKDTSELLK